MKKPDADANKLVKLPTVITLCIACLTGAWALSAELHNYRLSNITERQEAFELSLRAKTEKNANQDLAIEHNTIIIETMADDIVEIKQDVKTLLLSNGY